MKPLAILGALVLTVMGALGASGRNIPWWGYDNMFAMSEFVVIAQPVAKTRDTRECTVLREGIPPTRVIGVSTDFESLYVLKGAKRKRFTVHHYREAPNPQDTEIIISEPDLITFQRKPGTQPFLMFLVRERDGRFAPVGGQIDPKMSLQKIYEP